MEQTELYELIMEQALHSIALRCNCEIEELTLQTETETITKGNLGLFGHVLLDLHEQYNVPMTYEEFTQFQTFPTIEAVVNHFFEYKTGGVLER